MTHGDKQQMDARVHPVALESGSGNSAQETFLSQFRASRASHSHGTFVRSSTQDQKQSGETKEKFIVARTEICNMLCPQNPQNLPWVCSRSSSGIALAGHQKKQTHTKLAQIRRFRPLDRNLPRARPGLAGPTPNSIPTIDQRCYCPPRWLLRPMARARRLTRLAGSAASWLPLPGCLPGWFPASVLRLHARHAIHATQCWPLEERFFCCSSTSSFYSLQHSPIFGSGSEYAIYEDNIHNSIPSTGRSFASQDGLDAINSLA
ncbi:predicted protein [Histoplasma capsulatum var. duboisii H88]|uniref:Predicted protein n=1 Tax=Ajellomyces capsulatus (strain H88) TaxID=544711 RepID=F0ULH4_AJEC8|nr:predicted protein [Histoplasma capsulatum var. duboisii H88]